MPQYVEVNGQNVEFPDGMPVGDIEAALKKNALSLPAAVSAGQAINANVNSIPRQLGLTARYGLEGLAQGAQVVTEPFRYFTDKLLPERGGVSNLVTGQAAPPKSTPLSVQAAKLADYIGLPAPETANERVIGDATRLVAGAGGLGGAAQIGARLPGMAGAVLSGLAANPTQQLSSAAGAGLAGGASREAGGGAVTQAGAALLGGVAGGLAPGAAQGMINAGRRIFAPALTPQQLDVQLSTVLGKAGADYSQLPANVQNSLRSQLKDSLQAGKELDPEAVRRLADFTAVGATPTRGMISQNPVQITREQNLAKMAANSADDGLHGLPLIQNRNNNTLIRNLNESGGVQGDPFAAGQSIAGRIQATNQGLAQSRDAAYGAARAMPGAKDPIYPDAVRNIYNALDEKGIVGDLPSTTSKYLNAFVSGPQKGPLGEMVAPPAFNVQAYENLQKQLSNAAMSPDSATRYAAGVARRALEDTKIQPIAQSGDAQALLTQLNQGRSAHRALMQYGESSPVVKAVVGGAEPDKLFQKFVLNGNLSDAQAVAKEAPIEPIKNAIVAHLKEKALSGQADEVGKFSQAAYNKALSQIGDRKLAAFFSPQEMEQLRSVGRVASYMQTQPVGSAVNNSNSGALVLGRGMDALNSIAGKIPFGKAAVIDPLRNINISISQRQAQNVVPGLLAPVDKPPFTPALLLPGLAAGGGLLSP